MSWFNRALTGTIGQKIIMAVTGLFLVTFLIEHLIGNWLLLDSDGTAFLAYCEFMKTNPIIKIAEYVLFAGFITHIVYAIIITRKNKMARPQGYAYNNPSANSSLFSRNMGLSGSIVFIFLVIHLKQFFITHKLMPSLNAAWTPERNLYDETIYVFTQEPLYVILYVVAMGLLGFHLNHGFQSAFQTLGLRHPKYTPFIKGLGTAFAIIVPALFAYIPLYIYFTHR